MERKSGLKYCTDDYKLSTPFAKCKPTCIASDTNDLLLSGELPGRPASKLALCEPSDGQVDRSEQMPVKYLLDVEEVKCQAGRNDALEPDFEGFSLAKKRSAKVANRIAFVDARRSEKIASCSHDFVREISRTSGEVRFRPLHSCRDRFCPVCAKKRSIRLAEKYLRKVQAFQAENSVCGYHLVLTFANGGNLKAIADIRASQRNFLRRSFWKKLGGIRGGLSSLEVTYNKTTGEWHPHLHLLIFTPAEIPCDANGFWIREFNQSVSDEWFSVTGDSFIIRGSRFNGNVIEMTKYISKPGDIEHMTDDKLRELFSWSDGRRFVSAFGGLWGLKVEDENEPEDSEEVWDGLLLTWNDKLSTYVPARTYVRKGNQVYSEEQFARLYGTVEDGNST